MNASVSQVMYVGFDDLAPPPAPRPVDPRARPSTPLSCTPSRAPADAALQPLRTYDAQRLEQDPRALAAVEERPEFACDEVLRRALVAQHERLE